MKKKIIYRIKIFTNSRVIHQYIYISCIKCLLISVLFTLDDCLIFAWCLCAMVAIWIHSGSWFFGWYNLLKEYTDKVVHKIHQQEVLSLLSLSGRYLPSIRVRQMMSCTTLINVPTEMIPNTLRKFNNISCIPCESSAKYFVF